MDILGIHDGHNASACLLRDGEVIHCIQEERLVREKNYDGFPTRAVEWILREEDPMRVERIALGGYSYSVPLSRREKVSYYREEQPSIRSRAQARIRSVGKRLLQVMGKYEAIKRRRIRRRRVGNLESFFESDQLNRLVMPVDHHRCHAATAYYGSPWRNGEPTLVLTLDGAGDGLCATVSVGEEGEIRRIAETEQGNSIGNIYARTTLVLGFIPFEHEYKIMGMAPYAGVDGAERVYQIFKDYLTVDGLKFKRKIPESTMHMVARLNRDLSFSRFDWISKGLQCATEDVVCEWVNNAVKETGIQRVALAGGVFMNVKLNQRISLLDGVKELFVFPSCGDESLSIGASYIAYRAGTGQSPAPIGSIYWGPTVDNEAAKSALRKAGDSLRYRKVTDVDTELGRLVAAGKIVARCRGRMEYGARALGNRSIFADPSRLEVVRQINKMIKNRDFWMPFAPIVLAERRHDYFHNPGDFDSPHMMMTFETTDRVEEMKAAVHPEDLTARPQMLREEHNPGCHRMLRTFEAETGRGVLLNTSFNLHGHPIVCSAEEAIMVLENSDLRYLGLADYLVEKRD